MNFEPLIVYCDCGRAGSAFTEVGLTDDHRLVLQWWCEDCEKAVYMFKTLADCWRECPLKENAAVVSDPPRRSRIESQDLHFLRRMGIRLPRANEPRTSRRRSPKTPAL